MSGIIARASVVVDELSANAISREFGKVPVMHREKLLKNCSIAKVCKWWKHYDCCCSSK